jgi:hypothetical protein
MPKRARRSGKTKIHTPHDDLISKMQSLSEIDLTDDVIIPLLSKLGFAKVEYTGGVSEGGKDIVCYGPDKFGDREIVAIQVKKIVPSAAANSRGNFSEIVTQLAQASEKPVYLPDGTSQIPHQVLFITCQPIEKRSLESRFERYAELRTKNLRIIDGVKLAELLYQNCDDICFRLTGSLAKLSRMSSQKLGNEPLLRAINSTTKIPIEQFAIDLDISTGRPNVLRLLNSIANSEGLTLKLSPTEWDDLRSASEELLSRYSIGILTKSHSEIEAAAEGRLKRSLTYQPVYKQIATTNDKLQKCFLIFRNHIERFREIHAFKMSQRIKLNNAIEESRRQLAKKSNSPIDKMRLTQTIEEASEALNSLGSCNLHPHTLQVIYQICERLEIGEQALESSQIVEWQAKLRLAAIECDCESADEIWTNVEGIIALCAMLKEKKAILQTDEGFDIGRPYEVRVDLSPLVSQLDLLASHLREVAENSLKDSTHGQNFLDVIETTNQIEAILQVIQPSSALFNSLLKRDPLQQSNQKIRFRIPFEKVVSVGVNILLLGDAGSGKTTCLQMLAKQRSGAGDQASRPSIFVPLGRMIYEYNQAQRTLGTQPSLKDALVHFIKRELAPDFSGKHLESTLRNGVILLLDGIDEAIRFAGWLPKEIKLLVKQYPMAQVVASSRVMGGFIPDVDFFNVSLLAFDDGQQDAFFERWLRDAPERLTALKSHLRIEPTIKELVRNPLLATLLCELARVRDDLPRTELDLLTDRVNLLTGEYDYFKQIPSRVRQRRDDLREVAKEVAWSLHKENRRYFEGDEFVSQIATELSMCISDVKICINELKVYCELIVSMEEPGSFGFGHLRFQEHLVGMNLAKRQWTEIEQLIGEAWWDGPLYFFLCSRINLREFLKYFEARHKRGTTKSRRLCDIVGKLPNSLKIAADIGDDTKGKIRAEIESQGLTDSSELFPSDVIEEQRKIEQDEIDRLQ